MKEADTHFLTFHQRNQFFSNSTKVNTGDCLKENKILQNNSSIG